MTVGGRVGALWIGGLEPYMDEAFLQVSHHVIALFCSSCILLHMIILNLFTFFLPECHEHDGRVWGSQHQGDDEQVHR